MSSAIRLGSDFGSYQIIEQIGAGTSGVVYKATKDGQNFALKILSTKGQIQNFDRARFSRESTLAARFNHVNLVKTFDFGFHDDVPFLAMELVDGPDLRSILDKGPLEAGRVIELGLALASALNAAHSLGITHRDIKPDNVLFSKDHGIKLIDFGLAGELDADENAKEVVGSGIYSSPEQLGFTKHITDERSDLYSLGVLLFEAATGRTPAVAENITALFQYFEKNQVPSILDINVALSPTLSKIIRKLMNLDPKGRYQSTQGLIYDLQNTAHFDSQILQKQPVLLGTRDVRAANKNELAGREDELAAILKNLNLALSGNGRGIALEGEPGVGKSRLAKEVVSEAKAKDKISIVGKCSFQEKDISLTVVRKILDNLLAQAQSSSHSERLKRHIGEASKGLEQILVRLNGEFQNYILESNYTKADNDITTTIYGLTVFFTELAKLEKGFVIMVDDIQWIDPVSTQLLALIFKDIAQYPILLLFTARNDNDSLESNSLFYKSIGSPLLVQYLIQPLKEEACLRIIKNHLGNLDVAPNLAQKLIEYSSGNSFLLIENIHRLSSSGLLYLKDKVWSVPDQNLNEIGLSHDAYELILKNIEDIPRDCFATIQNFAAYGSTSDVDNLAVLTGLPAEQIREHLERIRKTGSVEKLDHGVYQFAHDRIKEAILSTLSDSAKKTIYQKFAKNRYAHLEATHSSHFLDLARFALNSDLNSDPEFFFDCIYLAGQRSNQDFAFSQAVAFLGRVHFLVSHPSIQVSQKWSFLSEYAWALVETGQIPLCLEVLGHLDSLSRSPEKILRVKTLRLFALQNIGKAVEVWELSLDVLKDYGITLPKVRLKLVFDVLTGIIGFLMVKDRKKETRLPMAQADYERNQRLAVVLNLAILNGIFISKDQLPAVWLLFKLHKIALDISPSLDLIKAKGWISLALTLLGRRAHKSLFKQLDEAKEIAHQLKTKVASAYAEYYRAQTLESVGEVVASERHWLLLLENYGNFLVSLDYSVMWVNLAFHYLFRGNAQGTLDTVAKCSPRSISENRRSNMQMIRYLKIMALISLGQTDEAQMIFEEATLKLKEFETGFIYHQTNYLGVSLYMDFVKGTFSDAVEERMRRFLSYQYKMNNSFYFAVIGYLRIMQIESEIHPENKKKAITKYLSEVKYLQKKIKNSMNEAHVHVLEAAACRYQKNFRKAAEQLKIAQNASDRTATEFGRFETVCEQARLFRDQNNLPSFEHAAKQALEIAKNNKWPHRIQTVGREFGIHDEVTDSRSAIDNSIYDERLIKSLLNISLNSSLELDPAKQIVHSLDEIIKVMGAERALVFLKGQGADGITFSGGRDYNQADIDSATAYSTTVVKKVYETQQPLVVVENEEMQALGSQSAVLHGLRSILAAPLVIKGVCNGVLYVDSSLAKCVFSNKDLDILAAMALQIGISFENVKMMKEEIRKNELVKDLELTAKVQSFLMPSENQISNETFELSGFTKPAVQCGGDWWWYHRQTDGRSYFFVGDVTGHGAGPAMLTSYVSACFDSTLKNSQSIDFDRLLPNLNDLLLNLTEGEFMMSCIAFEIDPVSKRLTVWNCASPGLLLMHKDAQIEHICEMSSFLGVSEFQATKSTLTLKPGDRILITTDGTMEMTLPTGEMLGLRRVRQLFQGTRQRPVSDSMADITRELEQIQGQRPQEDDITMLYLEIK